MKKLGLVACAFALAFSLESSGALRKWNERMQELAGVINELLPELSRNTTADADALAKNAKKLSELVHVLGVNPGGKSMLPPDADPTLVLVQNLFERETKRAYRAIKNGHVEYGKGILRASTGYCIACHSRNASGPDFPTITLSPNAESLSRFERAQLLAATRQFDGAIDLLAGLAKDEGYAKERPLEWNRAVKQAMTLAVRVKEDPDRALAILEESGKVNPIQFVRQDAESWKRSLNEWKKEKGKPANTEAALHRKAKQLMDQAKTIQAFPVDRSADVLYLRATALLHEQLRVAPKGKLAPEALFLLGKSYEVLGDLQSEPWHELFYESCITQRPHSPLARSCYDAYESSIHFGYSGSGGFSVPEDVQAMLNELRTLAAAPAKQK